MAGNGYTALAVLNDIAATSSRTEKEAILAKWIDDPFLQRVLVYALDPYKTYGVADTTFPKVISEGRLEMREDSVHWLLLDGMIARTITGNDALGRLQDMLLEMTPESAELMKRIILKDLRAGISEKTVNKLRKGLIPTFGCMLAHPFEEKRVKEFPVNVEPKLDGWRTLAFVSQSDVRFLSRSGREYTTLDHIKPHLLSLAKKVGWAGTMVLESEVMSGTFDKTSSELRRKDEQATDAKLFIFDILPESVFRGEKWSATFVERRVGLMQLAKHFDPAGPLKLLPSYLANSHEEIMTYYGKFRERGLEGAIVKDRAAIYEPKRSYAWQKIKPEESEDLVVIGAFEGTGKYAGMAGGIVVDRQGVEVSVGGGFSDDQRKEIWEAWLADQEAVPGARVLIGRVAEVEYHEVTPDGSLRHPRFVRWRDDKSAV